MARGDVAAAIYAFALVALVWRVLRWTIRPERPAFGWWRW